MREKKFLLTLLLKDTILQDIIDKYNIPDMKNTMDETGKVPENI